MADNGNMRRQLGVSRRDLLRRGAIVGGTLIWTIPVVSTISRAHGQNVKSPAFVCCECRKPTLVKDPPIKCQPKSVDTPSQCQAACKADGYTIGFFHLSPSFIACADGSPEFPGDPTGCAAH